MHEGILDAELQKVLCESMLSNAKFTWIDFHNNINKDTDLTKHEFVAWIDKS